MFLKANPLNKELKKSLDKTAMNREVHFGIDKMMSASVQLQNSTQVKLVRLLYSSNNYLLITPFVQITSYFTQTCIGTYITAIKFIFMQMALETLRQHILKQT